MRICGLCLLVALSIGCPGPPPDPGQVRAGLVINEVMAANDTAIRDPDNPECPEFDDWVELVNDSPNPTRLLGVELRDSERGFALPDITLGPDEHVVVWADGQPEQGPLHAPFKITASGESLTLLRDGTEIDSIDVPEVGRDHSYGRLRDGVDDWGEVAVPTPGLPNHRVFPDDPCLAPPTGFDDHSYPCIRDRDSFLSLTGARTDLAVVKFDIFAFSDPDQRRIRFVDSEFYTLHDQYYIFTFLNGQVFEGLYAYPPYPGSFRTWSEVEQWARARDLSEDFESRQIGWSGTRLYSKYFYDEINGTQRTIGVGTVIHRAATRERPEFWGFELEYGDSIAYEDLVVYFKMLALHGPPEFAQIKWLVRSGAQEAVARRMIAERRPYFDRVVRYEDLATPGEVQVYNPGRTAGRVRRIRAGEGGLESSLPTDILILEQIPDYLPPCAALLTSVPQTPLSHISLLARSRGIPNLYVAGITTDAEWDEWARGRARVVIEATGTDQLRAGSISRTNYDRWRALLETNLTDIVPVDIEGLPYAIDLATAQGMLALRPIVGGKAAGMRQLLLEPTLDAPDTPMALTVRAYHEHLATLDWLPALLETPAFTDRDELRDRFLILEGKAAYDVRYPLLADATAANEFLARNPPGTRAGDLARADGLRGAIQNTPVSPTLAAALTDAVDAQFAWLDPAQGLRFRSSSTIEDVEGFNGAGLYISATGFRRPGDGEPSVEQAIRAVWASYWGAEAFEEREAARLKHLDGGMGLLVHPRFDDEYELSNAVLTTSIFPDGHVEMAVNTQEGAISVANPPTTCPPVLPETALVSDAGNIAVTRLQKSTELPDGQVLTDAQLIDLFDASRAVLLAWLAEENAALPAPHRRSVLTLDLESREMAAGWPAGTSDAPRLVIKQSRSLEPSVAVLPDEIQALPAPRDLLARAQIVREMACADYRLSIEVRSLHSDPLQPPDMGWATERFVIEVELTALEDIPDLGLVTGDTLRWNHLELDAEHDTDSLSAQVDGGSILIAEGEYALDLPGGTLDGTAVCIEETLWASPDNFLLEFLE